MTNIQSVISKYRANMEAAGLLRRAAVSKLSPQVARMRPSLTKVKLALQERPPVVETSPITVLFEVTIPKIEHLLVDLGEERAEQIIGRLCEHGQRMIEEHGADGARQDLEELFGDVANYDAQRGNENGIKEIIEVYRKLHFEGSSEAYLRFKLGSKIENLEIDTNGMLWLTIKDATDSDLFYLRRSEDLSGLEIGKQGLSGSFYPKVTDAGLGYLAGCHNLENLGLAFSKISKMGLDHLNGLEKLEYLDLTLTNIGDDGLARLANLSQLQVLMLPATGITDEGLVILAGFPLLQRLDLMGNEITNAGLRHLQGFRQLRHLKLTDTKIDKEGLDDLMALSGLASIDLGGTNIGLPDIDRLQLAIPGISVSYDTANMMAK